MNNENSNNSFIQKEKILKERFKTETMSMLERVEYYNVRINL